MTLLPSLLRCLTLLSVLIVVFQLSSARAEEPFATGDFLSACALAVKTKRIVLLDFYTTWCGPCKKLDAITWKDKAVREWMIQTAISRKIDAEKETALAAKYKIRAYPTILLLKPDGTEIDRLIGFLEPQAFLTEVKQALSGQDSIARAKTSMNKNGKDDPMERIKYAGALDGKGHNAEALKEYLWCLDEGNKHNQGFYGVRLSFLLGDIVRLGSHYPPAMAALRQRRDTAKLALENGSTNTDMAMDFVSYNDNLANQAGTLALYDSMKTKSTLVATTLFRSIAPLLLERKRYAELITGTGDPAVYIDSQITMYKSMAGNAGMDKQIKDYMKNDMVKTCAGIYEALTGTDKMAEADSVRDKLLAIDPGKDTYAELIRHAVRAEKPEMALKLKEAARIALPSDAFTQLSTQFD